MAEKSDSLDDLFGDLESSEQKETKETPEKLPEEGSLEVPPGEIPVPADSDLEVVHDSDAETVEEPVGQGEAVTDSTPLAVPPAPLEETKPVADEFSDLLDAEQSSEQVEPEPEVAPQPEVVKPTQEVQETEVKKSADDFFATAVEPKAESDPLFADDEVAAPESLQSEVLDEKVDFREPVLPGEEKLIFSLPSVPATFDVSPAKPAVHKIIMIYGNKGDAKTTLALSAPGRIAAISFDRKTTEVWAEIFAGTDRIIVFDGLRYMDWSSQAAWLKSSKISLLYIDKLVKEIRKFEPDWILIDGSAGYVKMCEHTMRYNNGFSLFSGISWQYWKERSLFIKQLHLECIAYVKKGLIYTAYVDAKELKKDERVTDVEELPKWVDIIEEQTDVVIRVKSRQTDEGRRFYALVESSKWNPMKTGILVDITIPDEVLNDPDKQPECFEQIFEASKPQSREEL